MFFVLGYHLAGYVNSFPWRFLHYTWECPNGRLISHPSPDRMFVLKICESHSVPCFEAWFTHSLVAINFVKNGWTWYLSLKKKTCIALSLKLVSDQCFFPMILDVLDMVILIWYSSPCGSSALQDTDGSSITRLWRWDKIKNWKAPQKMQSFCQPNMARCGFNHGKLKWQNINLNKNHVFSYGGLIFG